MTDRLLERLWAIGIGIAPDFRAGEILVDRELVLEAIRRIEAQNAEIERLRGIVNELRAALGPYPLAVNIKCENPQEVAAHVIDVWKQMRREGEE